MISTLHQKLKFVREGKVVIINGEQALLISHLSSFSIVEADEAAVGTQFQALSIDNIRRNENSMVSLKDAQQVVRKGHNEVWGRIVDPPVNKNRTGLGFSSKNIKGESLKSKSTMSSYHMFSASEVTSIQLILELILFKRMKQSRKCRIM